MNISGSHTESTFNKMPKVKLNELDFYYEVEGKGPPLVLIAGLSADSSRWSLVKPLLAKHFQVITVDNRGVGRTAVPADFYTIEEMGEDVIRLLQHLNLSKVHLLGHSMGGAIAQTIAHRYPQYLDRLIISNSFVKITPRALFWMRHCAQLYETQKSFEETIPVVAPWVFSNEFFTDPQKMEGLLAWRKKYPYPQSPKGFRQQVEAIASFDSRAWVHEICIPTCIIAGKEDILTPMEGSEYLHEHIQHSHFVLHEGAHMPMMELPGKYVEVIKNFLM